MSFSFSPLKVQEWFFFFLISWHLSTAYCMPGTVLSALHVLSHLILIVELLQGFPLCRAEETAP